MSVVSTPDTTPPVIKGVKVAPSTVDTSKATKKVTVTIKASDSQSGVAGVYASANVVIKGHSYGTYGSSLKKKSGTIKNGTWVVVMTVPRWVQAGSHVWKLSVSASDKADAYGNGVTLTSAQLKAKHFAASFKVKSKTDASKPVLKGLTYTPHSVDARTKNKTVAFTVKATDTLSGISYVTVTIKSPSGCTSTGYLARHSGTALKGTFTGKVVVPRCSEPGKWTVSAADRRRGRQRHLAHTGAIEGEALRSTLSVKAIDTVGSDSQGAGQGVGGGSDHVDLLRADAVEELGGQHAGRRTTTAKSEQPARGTWTCKNAAACNGARATRTAPT